MIGYGDLPGGLVLKVACCVYGEVERRSKTHRLKRESEDELLQIPEEALERYSDVKLV